MDKVGRGDDRDPLHLRKLFDNSATVEPTIATVLHAAIGRLGLVLHSGTVDIVPATDV